MAIPFGQTLHLWRLHRGLTQQELAERAHLPRPNLSAIERGHREVSLSTLRALALALDVSPGSLVDGVAPPRPEVPGTFTRRVLERIADGVVGGAQVHTDERWLVRLLRQVVRHRVEAAAGRRGAPRRGRRVTEAAWTSLRARVPSAILQNLLERIDDRLRFA